MKPSNKTAQRTRILWQAACNGRGSRVGVPIYQQRPLSTQEQLRLSEERFRAALHGAPIVVFNQGLDLCYTWVHNPLVSDEEAEAMLGKHDRDVMEVPAEAELLTELKQSVLDTGKGLRQEVQMTMRGKPRYYNLTLEAAA
ncbi:MAG: hypothetical protein HC915_11545 [Anaerolineae bacterium]|nr:hypothetical protein [Anaerolineae bacterium]